MWGLQFVLAFVFICFWYLLVSCLLFIFSLVFGLLELVIRVVLLLCLLS